MERQPFDAVIARQVELMEIHAICQQAQDELEAHIGRSICMPNCGKCCLHNTPMVWGFEVEFMVSSLLGDNQKLDNILDRCEGWLLYNDGKIRSPNYYRQNPGKIIERSHDIITSPCPMMDEITLQCLIHAYRPLVCRAFGVTTYPRNCPRPPGLGESDVVRSYNQGLGEKINAALHKLLVGYAKESSFAITVGFLPTLLVSRLRANWFAGLVDSGRVDPVKLVRNYIASPAALIESQFTEFNLAGDKALQEVESSGIHTGPVMAVVK